MCKRRISSTQGKNGLGAIPECCSGLDILYWLFYFTGLGLPHPGSLCTLIVECVHPSPEGEGGWAYQASCFLLRTYSYGPWTIGAQSAPSEVVFPALNEWQKTCKQCRIINSLAYIYFSLKKSLQPGVTGSPWRWSIFRINKIRNRFYAG